MIARAVVFLVLCAAPLFAADVRVRLFWLHPPEKITIKADASGVTVRTCAACPREQFKDVADFRATGALIQFGGRRLQEVWVDGEFRLESSGQSEPSRLRWPLHVQARDGRLLLTISIPREEYVAAVLAGESGGFKSAEALKAMAVAARTFAEHFPGRHQREGFDFCDTTHCQDARFADDPPRAREAVDATANEMDWFNGAPIAAYYHAHCGGRTESAEALEGHSLPYLPSQADNACIRGGRADWLSEIKLADLQRVLAAAGENSAHAIEVAQRSESGRVLELRVISNRSLRIAEARFRSVVGATLGWNVLRSDAYEIRSEGDHFVFRGRGFGHGVGLCQAGAEQMGLAGRDYRDILGFYYPGTKVGIAATGFAWRSLSTSRVQLFTTEPAADSELPQLAEHLLRQAEEIAGWELSGPVRVRVYPTVATFRDATGQPGWVAAYTRGRAIHLQPARILQARGVLESTLRHELLHILVESRAQGGLPLWFREGLVLFLEGKQGAPAGDLAKVEDALRSGTAREHVERARRQATGRVGELVIKYGRARVIAWLESGIPTNP